MHTANEIADGAKMPDPRYAMTATEMNAAKQSFGLPTTEPESPLASACDTIDRDAEELFKSIADLESRVQHITKQYPPNDDASPQYAPLANDNSSLVLQRLSTIHLNLRKTIDHIQAVADKVER